MPDTPTTYLIPVRASGIPGIGTQALCPQCSHWTGIRPHDHPFKPGELTTHTTPNGILCNGSGMTITRKAALARDNRLNPQEQAAYNGTQRHLNGCRGPLIDDECHHPACHQATSKGLRWTLEGWRTTTDHALF